MSDIDVLTIRPPRFYTDGVTPVIFPREVLIPTILEDNSIYSKFLNVDFARYKRKFGLYTNINNYIFFKERLKKFLEQDNPKWRYLKKNIISLNPKVILLIMRMPSDLSVTLKTAKIVKEINPNIKIGVWRLANEHYHREIAPRFLSNNIIDFVIMGEPEHTFLEVCKNLLEGKNINKIDGLALRSRNGKTVFTKKRKVETNLDKFPMPDRDLVVDKKYYRPSNFGLIEGGRGCMYNCNFCILRGIPFRLRSPENVVEEIAQTYLKYGTREFQFIMSSFLHSKPWAISVCNLIKKLKLDIIFGIYANTNEVNKKIAETLKSAGCYSIALGIESGSCDVLKKMGKVSNLDIEKTKKAAKIIKDEGMFLRTGFIIGNSGESLEDIIVSIDILKEINPDVFRVQFLVPFLGTKIYKDLKSKNMIIDENIDEYTTGEIKVKTEIDHETLKRIWMKYAKLSDLCELIIIRKKLLNYKIVRCKSIEHIRHLLNIIF